ncbi:MAG TPA: ThiF family adenylyltransferase [Pirellulales bacterium]|nr:ThiF family adenylyltransferase [Pirellulales bacterium]
MDLTRIADVIDVTKTLAACVAVFGAGGSAGLVCNLARSGVSRFKLFDFDRISPANVARQQHDATDVGRSKVAALADAIRRINPDAMVEVTKDSFLDMADDELAAHMAECDLLIFATDRFEAQARGNELALEYSVPALWIGLYAGGTAGEIIFWHPGIDACFRCLCAKRYEAQAVASNEQRSLDPASDGCTIFDVALLDAIVGMLAIGLLTRGSDNRFGRLIDELGDRNFLQVQLDPSWDFNGSSPVRKYLGVAADNEAFFAWNSIVRADPDHGVPPCDDCERFRNHFLGNVHGIPCRFRGDRLAKPKSS